MGAPLTVSRHKLSIEDFHEMGRAGILQEGSRIELIEGELIDMAPIGSVHASVVSALSTFFARHVGESAIVWTQNPVRLPPDSELQPDLALLKPCPGRYRDALPTAAGVLLIIEVADTTVEYDREIKLRLYAQHAIPEVWLVDLKAGTLEAYREPAADGYRTVLKPERGGSIAPAVFREVQLPLSEVWPG